MYNIRKRDLQENDDLRRLESPGDSERIATRNMPVPFGQWHGANKKNAIFDYLNEPFMVRRVSNGFYAATLKLIDPAAGSAWQTERRAISEFVAGQPHVAQAGRLSLIAENASWICSPTVDSLQRATDFVAAFRSSRPLQAAKAPLSLKEAQAMTSAFPRFGSQAARNADAEKLFLKHWATPLTEGTLVLGHYRLLDPEGYAAMAGAVKPNPLFERLNSLLRRSVGARPPAPPPGFSQSAPA